MVTEATMATVARRGRLEGMARRRTPVHRLPVDASQVAPIVDKLKAAKASGAFVLPNRTETALLKAFLVQLRAMGLTMARCADLTGLSVATVEKWVTEATDLAPRVSAELVADAHAWAVRTLSERALDAYERDNFTEGRLHVMAAAELLGLTAKAQVNVDARQLHMHEHPPPTELAEALQRELARSNEIAERIEARRAAERSLPASPPSPPSGNGHPK